MNIYKITRTDHWSYDEFDSFVCYAENAKQAAEFVPHYDTEQSVGDLVEHSADHWSETMCFSSWTSDPNAVKVELLGRSATVRLPKLILCSFNAG